jgi:hypothetical protein
MLFLSEPRAYLVRLELDDDEFGRSTMTKTFFARTSAEARELARLELGMTGYEAERKLTVKMM